MTITELIESGQTFMPDVMPYTSFPVDDGAAGGTVASATPANGFTDRELDDLFAITPRVKVTETVVAEPAGMLAAVPTWAWWVGGAALAWLVLPKLMRRRG